MSKVYAPRSDDGGLKLLTIVYQLIFLRVCRGWVQRSNQSLDKDWTATSGALQLKWVHCLVSYLPASVVQTGLQKSWRAARTRSQGNVYCSKFSSLNTQSKRILGWEDCSCGGVGSWQKIYWYGELGRARDVKSAALLLLDTRNTHTNRTIPYAVLISRTLESIPQYL